MPTLHRRVSRFASSPVRQQKHRLPRCGSHGGPHKSGPVGLLWPGRFSLSLFDLFDLRTVTRFCHPVDLCPFITPHPFKSNPASYVAREGA